MVYRPKPVVSPALRHHLTAAKRALDQVLYHNGIGFALAVSLLVTPGGPAGMAVIPLMRVMYTAMTL